MLRFESARSRLLDPGDAQSIRLPAGRCEGWRGREGTLGHSNAPRLVAVHPSHRCAAPALPARLARHPTVKHLAPSSLADRPLRAGERADVVEDQQRTCRRSALHRCQILCDDAAIVGRVKVRGTAVLPRMAPVPLRDRRGAVAKMNREATGLRLGEYRSGRIRHQTFSPARSDAEIEHLDLCRWHSVLEEYRRAAKVVAELADHPRRWAQAAQRQLHEARLSLAVVCEVPHAAQAERIQIQGSRCTSRQGLHHPQLVLLCLLLGRQICCIGARVLFLSSPHAPTCQTSSAGGGFGPSAEGVGRCGDQQEGRNDVRAHHLCERAATDSRR
eukprot:7391940-Prymnesium_polylepis.2